MTPIDQVFMLSIDARLDYETLRQVCMTGHSRIPVYDEVDVPVATLIAVVGRRACCAFLLANVLEIREHTITQSVHWKLEPSVPV